MTDKIRIGPLDYTIIVEKNLVNANEERMNGLVHYDTQEIKIDDKGTVAFRKIAILHEAMHAILVQAGIHEHDEQAVEALAYGVYGLIRDNPGLVSIKC